MAQGFICLYCGNSSLVRSNFKFTVQNKPFCADKEACSIRMNSPDTWTALRMLKDLYRQRHKRRLL